MPNTTAVTTTTCTAISAAGAAVAAARRRAGSPPVPISAPFPPSRTHRPAPRRAPLGLLPPAPPKEPAEVLAVAVQRAGLAEKPLREGVDPRSALLPPLLRARRGQLRNPLPLPARASAEQGPQLPTAFSE